MLRWVLLLALTSSTPAFAQQGDAERGMTLLFEHRCMACHSVNAGGSSGPGLAGIWGRTERARRGDERVEIVVDAAYIERSLATPDAEVVQGYAKGSMSAYTLPPADVADIVALLKTLKRPEPTPPPSLPPFTSIVAAAIAFIGAHLTLSSGVVRPKLVGALGLLRFHLLYSAIVSAALAWLILAWMSAPVVMLWPQTWWSRWVPLLGMPVAYVLLVESLLTPNPTAAGQEGALASANPVRAVVKITRHPMLWSFTLWGLVHLPPNGDVAAVVLFGSVAGLGLLGMVHIDHRRAAAHSELWAAFSAQTSRFPFVAVLQGRARLQRGDLRWSSLAIGLGGAIAMFFLHEWAIGVSAWPLSWLSA